MSMKRAALPFNAQMVETQGHLSLHFNDVFFALANAEPENLRRTARWKNAEPAEGSGKGVHTKRTGECLNDRRRYVLGDLAEERQCQVHLLWPDPFWGSIRCEG